MDNRIHEIDLTKFDWRDMARGAGERFCLDCELTFSPDQAIDGKCPWCGSGASFLTSRCPGLVGPGSVKKSEA